MGSRWDQPGGGPGAPAAAGEIPDARCPQCRAGDLFPIGVLRRGATIWRGSYCAGVFDRGRRRFLRRSCGYSEADLALRAPERRPPRPAGSTPGG